MHEFLMYPILFSIIHNRVEILYKKKSKFGDDL